MTDELESLLRDFLERQVTAQLVRKSESDEIHRLLGKVAGEAEGLRRASEITRHAIAAPVLDECASFLSHRQFSLLGTLEEIATQQVSFARFRENELRLALDPLAHSGIQTSNLVMSSLLLDVLATQADGIVVGLPQFNRDVFWSKIWAQYWGRLSRYVKHVERFGNSHVTRPVVFDVLGMRAASLWRESWRGCRALLVPGRKTDVEAWSSLLSGASSAEIHPRTSIDSALDLETLLLEVRRREPEVVLLSLGPWAPVAVSRLSGLGIRSLDVGALAESFQRAGLEGS